jgi:hypothetical protein
MKIISIRFLALSSILWISTLAFAADEVPPAPEKQETPVIGTWVGNSERIVFLDKQTYTLPPEKAIHSYSRDKSVLTLSSFDGEENVKAFIVETEFANILTLPESKTTLYHLQDVEWKKEDLVGLWKYTSSKGTEYRDTFCCIRNENGSYSYYLLTLFPESKTYEFFPDTGSWTLTKDGVFTEMSRDNDPAIDDGPLRIQYIRKGKDWLSFILLDQDEPYPLTIERKATAEDLFIIPPKGYTPETVEE